MGYRGDDAARMRGDSRHQQPWRPPQEEPGGHDGGYGTAPYSDYDGYGDAGGYGSADGNGYGDTNGYGDPDAFGGGGGYDSADGNGYDGTTGFGDANGYPGTGRHGESPGYPGQAHDSGGYKIPGDYGRISGDYGPGSAGGYDRPAGGFPDNDWYGGTRGGGFADTTIHVRPAIPEGYRPGDYDTGPRRADGQEPPRPDFRDTARGAARDLPPAMPTLSAPPPVETGPMSAVPMSAPRMDPSRMDAAPMDAMPMDAGPAGRLRQTRQQQALDEGGYDAVYPGYEKVEEPPGLSGYGTGGYPAQGYDDYDDYAGFAPEYEMPAPTTANPAYTEPSPTGANPAYAEPAYAAPGPEFDVPEEFGTGPHRDPTAVIDGYDDTFDGLGSGPGTASGLGGARPDEADIAGTGTRTGRQPRISPGRPGRESKTDRFWTRRKVAVLGLSAICLIAAVVSVYAFLFKPTGEEADANAPLPKQGSTSAATAACVKQFGQYCHIEYRTDDPAPLTIAEMFPPAVENTKDHISFQRIGTRMDKTCSNAVLGQSLTSALQSGKCTQVLRASYVAGSGSSQIMGTIGIANLSSTNQAHYAGKEVGANDFLSPLATSSGVGANLGQSTGVMQATYKGHYLILTWAEMANEATPTNADNQKLMQFENDLVASTANIALSQRMVSGQPGTGN